MDSITQASVGVVVCIHKFFVSQITCGPEPTHFIAFARTDLTGVEKANVRAPLKGSGIISVD